MEFNNSTDKEKSLYHAALKTLGIKLTNTTSYPVDPDFTQDANIWYRKCDSWIWEAAKSPLWDYDDSNYTDFDIVTTTLVAGQEDYPVPSTARMIDRVEVKDSAGNYQLLDPISLTDIKAQSLTEYLKTNGMPREWLMRGNSVIIKPGPAAANVTTSAGLKFYLRREISEFTPADTTKEPGFDKNFHKLVALGAALEYAMANELTSKIPFINAMIYGGVIGGSRIRGMKEELEEFFKTRYRAAQPRISVPSEDWR